MKPNEEPPDVTGVFSALAAGFRLSRKDQALLLRVLWVLSVSIHIAWACGWLTALGLIGFARADDVHNIQKTIDATARVTLSQEIRAQISLRCRVPDQSVKDSITRYVDSLQDDYERITGHRYPEAQCGQGG